MSDSLTIFGTDYTGVTGIKTTGTGNGTLTYIRPQGTLSVTANGTGINVTEYASIDVNVAGNVDNTFIITVSWNSTTEKWEPDCTYAQVQAAYQAGKTIVVDAYGDASQASADGDWESERLNYWVRQFDDNSIIESQYNLNSTGLSLSAQWTYVVPPSGTINIVQNDTSIDVSQYAYADVSVTSNLQAKTNINPATSSQTITADAGYDGLSSVQINAMPSGSVSASATKGAVSNHSISVTPKATVGTAGYLAAGDTTGTAVSVAASELVSGTYTVDSSGTKDVTNYASASIASGSATASATKGTVSNHSVSVTPKVTRTAGWVTGGTANGTAVSVSASELVSGSETKTANGTYDVTNLASLIVALDFATYYVSSSNPTGGNNGDIWLKTVS